MPYEIKHKSHNACLIKYTKSKRSHRKKRYDLTLVVLGVFAVTIGVDLVFVVLSLLAVGIILQAVQPPYFNFEIELNHRKNQVLIKNTDQAQPKVTTHSLAHFTGFGLRELTPPQKSNHKSQAELYLKMEPNRGLFKKVPIWKFEYPVSLANAIKIIDATDEWLRLTDDRLADDKSRIENKYLLDELVPEEKEEEIFRDFRDMD